LREGGAFWRKQRGKTPMVFGPQTLADTNTASAASLGDGAFSKEGDKKNQGSREKRLEGKMLSDHEKKEKNRVSRRMPRRIKRNFPSPRDRERKGGSGEKKSGRRGGERRRGRRRLDVEGEGKEEKEKLKGGGGVEGRSFCKRRSSLDERLGEPD